MSNGKAARDFGNVVLSQSKHNINSTVAVLYDKNDPVANVEYVRKLSSQYLNGGVVIEDSMPTFLTSCVLNFTDHSMLSRWDEIHNNKWWIDELSCRVASYLSFSSEYILAMNVTDSESEDEYFCELTCTSETCHYNRSASSVVCR